MWLGETVGRKDMEVVYMAATMTLLPVCRALFHA
jgi:hypothetical protein